MSAIVLKDVSVTYSEAADPVLAGLHAHGITVVLQLNGTSGWANGGQPSNYAPTSPTTCRPRSRRARDGGSPLPGNARG